MSPVWGMCSHERDNFQMLILSRILDTDALTDMVSIMVNKHEYKPSLQDVMDNQTYSFFSSSSSSTRFPRERIESMGVNIDISDLEFRQGCVWVSFSHVLHESRIHPKDDQYPNFTRFETHV